MQNQSFKLFQFGLIFVFALQFLATMTAMIMIERMIPLHDSELRQILEQDKALRIIALHLTDTRHEEKKLDVEMMSALALIDQPKLWPEDQNVLLENLRKHLRDKPSVGDSELAIHSSKLLLLQANRLEKKLDSSKLKALAGSWAVGIISLIGFGIIYRYYVRMRDYVMHPALEIVSGLHDWNQGNRQRRIQFSKQSGEFREAVIVVNSLLDGR